MSIREPAEILIVGGGITGVTAAVSLRDEGYRGGITIVEASTDCTDHPPLSKRVLVSGVAQGDLALLPRERADALNVNIIAGVEARAIDAAAHTVSLSDGRLLSAEAIVVAVGSEPNQLEGYSAHPRVMTLRDYDDALAIRKHGGAGSTVVVVGGGFIGAEVAASLHECGAHVVIVEPHEIPGAHLLGQTLARWLHAMHTEHGVDVRRTRVSAIDGGAFAGDDRMRVALVDGSSIEADLVVVGVGVSARVIAGAERLVPPTGLLISPSHHWDAARLDGIDAAALLLGNSPAVRGAPWYWSDRYGHHIEVVGDLVGNGSSGAPFDVVRPGNAVFRVDGDVLLGAASIDDPMTVRAARRMIDRRVQVDREALADPSLSLRRMLRA